MSYRLFCPQRLTLARQKRLLTKTVLASKAGVASRSISAYESGDTTPTSETIMGLASVLRFPVEFFFASPINRPEVEAVSFRSLSSMTAAKRDSALAAGAFAVELSSWIEGRFLLPKWKLTDADFRGYMPEAAAAAVRTLWGLGERPIKNTIHLLEANGVRVFSLAEESKEVDAFSFWQEGTPFVFLNTMKSPERSRFDAMHELGHLILHRHGGPCPEGRVAESEADAFASAMLMPRGDVLAHPPKFASLPVLIEMKKRWDVSVAALNYRLHSLGLISDWHYRTLCIQISEKNYRTKEPSPCQRETSQLLQKVFAALKDDGVTRSDVAASLCMRTEDLEALIFGLVLTGIGGGKKGGGAPGNRQHLRIVTSND
ncbi:XRE family transcriptional regulator [Geomonas nitrogeniifigens]|uniref:XRE family transcriptional regulator n=2 Tax=Geomonas diazotrophica TaxID=2843197 RepID=A0ABX8JMP8_9BACT|nr:XRE family transcriptional regulator [Geomonas nitrogeniifigens]